MARLGKILVFPIKSLSPIALNQVQISEGGALKCDREFALFDQSGNYINAKRYPQIHCIRASYDLDERLVHLQVPDHPTHKTHKEVSTFHLDQEQDLLANWFSQFFEQPVEIRQNTVNGFPDDPDAWGATVISEATLIAVQNWYVHDPIELNQIRDRFRTNLEIIDTAPFWEDHLFGKAGSTFPFRIGDVQFLGTNPCQRCPVPTRHPFTGEVYPNFAKIFATQRQITLPPQVEKSRFNHFYRLALNTRIPITEAGKLLKVGDGVFSPA